MVEKEFEKVNSTLVEVIDLKESTSLTENERRTFLDFKMLP